MLGESIQEPIRKLKNNTRSENFQLSVLAVSRTNRIERRMNALKPKVFEYFLTSSQEQLRIKYFGFDSCIRLLLTHNSNDFSEGKNFSEGKRTAVIKTSVQSLRVNFSFTHDLWVVYVFSHHKQFSPRLPLSRYTQLYCDRFARRTLRQL